MSRFNNNPRKIRLHHGDIVEEGLAILRAVRDDPNASPDDVETQAKLAEGFFLAAGEIRAWVTRDRVTLASDRHDDFDRDDFPEEAAV